MSHRTICEFLVLLLILGVTSGTCDTDGAFGENCKFKCRCKDDAPCDKVTGYCTSGCDPIWMGPACQYGNLAYKRISSGYGNNLQAVTDGYKASCATGYNSGANRYITIDLGSQFHIERMTIYNKDYGTHPLYGFSVYIGESTIDYRWCHTDPSVVGKLDIDVRCGSSLNGRYIKVVLPDINTSMRICEIEVFGGLNGAYNKFTDQSSTLVQASGRTYSSSFGVNGIVGENDFTHTAQPQPNGGELWWYVGLGERMVIQLIRIYNNWFQTGRFAYRLNGAKLTIYDGLIPVFQHTIYVSNSQMIDILITQTKIGNKVELRLNANREPLHISEMEVFYSCPYNSFGIECKYCYCKSGCDKIYGTCPGACEDGYTGKDGANVGDCQTPCADGRFGPDCINACNCEDQTEACRNTDGFCQRSGCRKGFNGTGCLQECFDGFFGSNCQNECNCEDISDVCDKAYGNCSGGCRHGFTGHDCLSECDDRTFGPECTHRCNCENSTEVCDKLDGKCDSGCKSGHEGYGCLNACKGGKFGLNCTQNCNCETTTDVCRNTDGFCKDGCKKGYTGDGCQDECEDMQFGSNCVKNCSCYNSTEVCRKADGYCTSGCETGFTGEGCLKTCSGGFYGRNCTETCGKCDSSICDHVNGSCTNGCQSGFTGSLCSEKLEGSGDDDDNTTAIIGAVVGIVLALAIVAVLLFILMKRRRSKSKGPPSTNEVFYENAADLGKARKEPRVSVIKKPAIQSKRESSKVKQSAVYEPEEVELDDESTGLEAAAVSQSADVYYNDGSATRSDAGVPVGDLWNYVSKMKHGAFEAEFEQLPKGMVKPYDAAKANMAKNRYRGIYAYDHTRVKLSPVNADGCDYMNACYIKGYQRNHEYIASQGATEQNIKDFWLMIWQQKCKSIVMLTNLIEEGRVKSLKYWPEEGIQAEHGSVNVTLEKEEVFCNFTIRHLRASKDGDSRAVRQYHFTAWPDKGVPSYPSSLVQFHRKIKRNLQDRNHPIVVHCSAGVGRTGTFIALDFLVNQANSEGVVDIIGCAQNLREQRVSMIQTLDQYIFVHTTLVEALYCKGHSMPSDEFRKLYEDINGTGGAAVLENDFRKLESVYSGYDVQFTEGQKPDNMMKNRHQTILPADNERPILNTNIAGCGNYINAVFLPGLRKRRQFIVTQTPLEGTVIDFWRMVYEQDTKVLVDLSSDPDNYQVYPDTSDLKIGPFTVTSTSKEHDEETDSMIQSLAVSYQEVNTVKRFKPKFWELKNKTPKSTALMMSLIYEVNRCGQYGLNGGIVVICPDGATRCGLFCAAFVSLDRLRVEQEVGTGQIIKQYRSIRPQVIPNKEQLKYCYDILMTYLNENETYSNFA